MKTRKVKAIPIREGPGWLFKPKLACAIFLDAVDFFIGGIPFFNTAWDFVTVGVLWLILKNKSWATVGLTELAIPAIPGLGVIDMFIPIATITVVADEFLETSPWELFKMYRK